MPSLFSRSQIFFKTSYILYLAAHVVSVVGYDMKMQQKEYA